MRGRQRLERVPQDNNDGYSQHASTEACALTSKRTHEHIGASTCVLDCEHVHTDATH